MREGAKSRQARTMRKAPTSAEQKLWTKLRRRQIEGFKFRRQHPIGPYVVDFACLDAKLIVEVDGATHGSEAEQARDAMRTECLKAEGWRIFRAWNTEVYRNLDGVLEGIRLAVLDR